ncbi:hypothetical protein [Corallococcus sp. Z5C101001]|uniref:hypothetical protein n=1 Tax=Corallococcus sp. Z5C101001 TaxID=2596829 RepID=UPI00118101A0|nr:hypothetical protein [Corallococcus sp. Z5C101001]TSC34108.1 hypothetical protein FOF48_03455 [Corallococcus sp. Z5C101001]
MKKSLGIFAGACLALGFAATVHANISGAQPGAATGVVTIYGGGTGTNPNPEFSGNCRAYLQLWDAVVTTQSLPHNWMTVAAATPAECMRLVNLYVNDPNTNWLVNTNLRVCECASPSMGRVLQLGASTVNWTQEQESSLNAELSELKEEYHINEYHERVQQLVEARIQ